METSLCTEAGGHAPGCDTACDPGWLSARAPFGGLHRAPEWGKDRKGAAWPQLNTRARTPSPAALLKTSPASSKDARPWPGNLPRVRWHQPLRLPPPTPTPGPAIGRVTRAAQDAAAPSHFHTGETPLPIIK